MADAFSTSASAGIRRASTSDFLEYEDDDEEFPVEHSATINEEDHAQEQFKQDFATAQAIQRDKTSQLSDVTDNGTLSDEAKAERRKSINGKFNEKFRDFVGRQQARWGDKTFEGAGARNFLHHLAYENPWNPSLQGYVYPQWLVKMASTSQPHLMGVVDGKGRTPLTAAIVEQNFLFCFHAILRLGDAEKGVLGENLKKECRTGREYDHDREATCLHAALSADFYKKHRLDRVNFITTIISLVPKAMFKIKDSKGRTPLHLAVQYENCIQSQEIIVEKLLREGPEALNVETQELGRSISIYQFHELSKRNQEAKYKKRREKTIEEQWKQQEREQMSHIRMPGRPENTAWGKEEKQTKLGTQTGKNDPKKAEPKPKRGLMEPPPKPTSKDKPGRTDKPDANVAVRRNSITSGTPPTRGAPQAPWLPERRVAGSSQVGASPVIRAQTSVEAKFEEMEQEEQGRRKTAAAISEQLKLLCLRNNEPDNASRFLRSLDGKRDKALWFDFGPSRKLNMKDFNRSFRHFRFESILQYVAFPHIHLVTKEGNLDDGRDRSATDTSPMVVLFEWLREKERGVTRIIRVIVDDLDFPSHTDEAIEKALAGFKVEILDWRRIDLCPASLVKIGGHLREVTLYWSGSNPVLRAWSETEGLARLPNLETVNILEVNGIESEDRVKENLEIFKTRLYNSWPKGKDKPKINPPIGERLRISSQRGDIQHASRESDNQHDRRVDSHRWMECMKKFSDEFRHIKELRETQRDADPALSPVVVALIDDGTDINHPDLSTQKNFHGQSFYKYKEGSGARMDPWWHSESGHGTLMARLIAGICPSAIIHIIKLHTFYAGESKKLQIEPTSARKAIEYATELGAQIISMSWTIKPPEEPAKTQFIQAINSAMVHSKGILMFCAASDQGKFPDQTFPHAVNPNIFRIGAAAATGKIMDTVGDHQGLSFILPGHEVVVDSWYDDVEDEALDKFEAHSGSSVATALAAALAALVIECVRLGVIHTNDSPPEQQHDSTVAIRMTDLQQIRDQETMKKALSSIGTDNNTNHLYLKVWDLFEKNADRLKAARLNREPGGQLEIISGLARHFLRKGIT